jgi:hypothetical protein
MRYAWTITGGTVDLSKTQFTRKLEIAPFSLVPLTTYTIRLQGFMEAEPDLRDNAVVTVMVGVSDVTAGLMGCAISGVCTRRIGDGGLLWLDASNSKDADISIQAPSQFSYAWSCVPVIGKTARDDLGCSNSNHQFDSTLSANAVKIQLDPLSLVSKLHNQDVSHYEFTVQIRSTRYGKIRENSRSIAIIVIPGTPPSVQLSRVVSLKSDTYAKANPSAQIMFRCTSSINITAPQTQAEYAWSSAGASLPLNWTSNFVSISDGTSLLTIPPNTLTANGKYSFECSAKEIVRGQEVSTNSDGATLVVNAPPSSGSINVVVGHNDNAGAEGSINDGILTGQIQNLITIEALHCTLLTIQLTYRTVSFFDTRS